MIVVDTSAIVAIVRQEAEGPIFTEILDASSAAIMSAVTFVETHLVLIGRRFQPDVKSIESTIAALGIEVVDVMHDQASLAVRSFLAYGKGRHQAQLNLADCFSYALAKSRGAPLLFKGEDFAETDITPAWRP
jgi:ribonuclease VapC